MRVEAIDLAIDQHVVGRRRPSTDVDGRKRAQNRARLGRSTHVDARRRR